MERVNQANQSSPQGVEQGSLSTFLQMPQANSRSAFSCSLTCRAVGSNVARIAGSTKVKQGHLQGKAHGKGRSP